MAIPDPAATTTEQAARYILITECLQNDLFLNPQCRLFLHDESVRSLLVAKKDVDAYPGDGTPRRIPEKLIDRGPLGLFLKATVGERLAGRREKALHVINIRDWHLPDDAYDAERRAYGRHCEAGTWGARYIEGLQKYLDPEEPLPDGRARFCARGSARIYHVHADSVFDFRPRWEERRAGQLKFHPSELELLLDVLVTGSDDEIENLAAELQRDRDDRPKQSELLQELATPTDRTRGMPQAAPTYVGVIGVYTDIKVQLLLSALRTRYELPNLAISDTLTGSRSLERHLYGLDFADKLLNVEVIHGIGDFACFLGSEPPLADESDTVSADNYAQYRSFFADKQSVLAYESDKRREYTELTAKRATGVYDTIKLANTFLLAWGTAFLTLTLVGAILHLASPGRWSWQLSAVTGGIGLLQLVAAFFSRPMKDLQANLNNLASFRMLLEGHSLKTAFTRFHLTTPEVLRELKNQEDLDRATAQIKALEEQLAVIDKSQASDYAALAAFVGAGSVDGSTDGGSTDGGATADATGGAEVPAGQDESG
jgi:hypothetical protein